MQLRASRFAVVDDTLEHAQLIQRTIEKLGRLCKLVHYQAEGVEESALDGVRVLFLDLHLTEGVPGSTKAREYAVIADLLMRAITKGGGPFVVVLWTKDPQYHDELQTFLNERLDGFEYARPATVLCLPKEPFVQAGADEQELRQAVDRVLEDVPQIAALLAWEDDVHRAASATLGHLLDVIPSKVNADTYKEQLDLLISRLAVEAVGLRNVPSDPRGALTAALAPILLDRMHYLPVLASDGSIWQNAITRSGDVNGISVTVSEAGKINRMLHVATSPPVIFPADLGAVVSLPDSIRDAFEACFGVPMPTAGSNEFFVAGAANREKCTWRLVRIGAACDQAQPKSAPLSFVLALEVPTDVARKPVTPERPRPSEWMSPILEASAGDRCFRLIANARYVVTFTRATVMAWEAPYRLRDQLVTELVSHVARFNSRPGIVAFHASEDVAEVDDLASEEAVPEPVRIGLAAKLMRALGLRH